LHRVNFKVPCHKPAWHSCTINTSIQYNWTIYEMLDLRFSQWRPWKVPFSRMCYHVVPQVTNSPPRVSEFISVYKASNSMWQLMEYSNPSALQYDTI
jgi:hypothetical protein